MSEETQDFQKKKDFVFRGKSLEELNKMNIREFAKIINSRERRSLLRNGDLTENFVARSLKSQEIGKMIKTHNRDVIIVPAMIGMTVYVYSGKTFEPIKIIPEMIGHRLGEFVLTRKTVKHGAAGIGATRSSASRSVK
ncbi:MAG TPA: 30S ribosomal protein S19 [Candidatus Paceibacterota bacterium]|nr:30S ribosomal protein S19 [Candidatus Paceibacterota bacterium]